jgi:MoxR-like ATPase
VGKTEVARALAAATGAELIRLQCHEGIDLHHAVYDWDYQRQLLAIRAAEAGAPARELHDALKRRCLYHWIDYPTPEREAEIVRTRLPGVPEEVAARVCHAVALLRERELYKLPGVGETITWARALLALDGDGTCSDVRVGLTHMSSTPLRATAVEDALRGQPLTADTIAAAAENAAEGTEPPSDLNASQDYKRHLARVLTKRALTAASQ